MGSVKDASKNLGKVPVWFIALAKKQFYRDVLEVALRN